MAPGAKGLWLRHAQPEHTVQAGGLPITPGIDAPMALFDGLAVLYLGLFRRAGALGYTRWDRVVEELPDFIVDVGMFAVEGRDVVGMLVDDAGAASFWHPIASRLTMHSLSCITRRSSGMAGTSSAKHY